MYTILVDFLKNRGLIIIMYGIIVLLIQLPFYLSDYVNVLNFFKTDGAHDCAAWFRIKKKYTNRKRDVSLLGIAVICCKMM